METLYQNIKACKLCGNYPKLEKSFLQKGNTNLLIVGASPAKDGWISSGRAFYNVNNKLQATGIVLNKLLNSIGLELENINFTELCKCQIIDRSRLNEYTKNCFPFLVEQLKEINCDIILPMGLYTTQAILQMKIKKFSDYVGKPMNIKFGDKTYLIIPIYHPSPANPKGYNGNLHIFQEVKKYIKQC